MSDTKHFWLTVLVLIGGPVLALHEPSYKDFVLSAATTVLGVWFGYRANGNKSKVE